jgi:hypothetical protein
VEGHDKALSLKVEMHISCVVLHIFSIRGT